MPGWIHSRSSTEDLSPYNTVGKLKTCASRKKTSKRRRRIWTSRLPSSACSIWLWNSAARPPTSRKLKWCCLPGTRVKQAETARKAMQEKLAQDRTAEHASEYRQTLNQLKKDYITAYIASHTKARLGVSEEKSRNTLRNDSRLQGLRVLAGVEMMNVSQLTAFEDALNGLKSCSALMSPR